MNLYIVSIPLQEQVLQIFQLGARKEKETKLKHSCKKKTLQRWKGRISNNTFQMALNSNWVLSLARFLRNVSLSFLAKIEEKKLSKLSFYPALRPINLVHLCPIIPKLLWELGNLFLSDQCFLRYIMMVSEASLVFHYNVTQTWEITVLV